MRFLLRFLARGVLLLALLVPLAVAAGFALVWWTLPPEHAQARIPTLDAPVAITLDVHGIPLIRATTEADGHRAMGWLHARDRLFQMEMMRRGATGRLSEIAGTATLRSDRFTRLLGLAHRAEADFASLPEATRAALTQYAEGVNAWIAAHGRFSAPEFLILGPPEPWRPVDSLLWAKVLGLWLSGNWRDDLERLRLAGRLPPERIAELWPRDTALGRPDVAEDRAALPGIERLAAQVPVFGVDAPVPSSASNAWVVAGARAAGGAPMLAADPHLGFSAPILWYLARIELPGGRFLAGATAPGAPFIIMGRNRDIAWGFTTTHSDTQDLAYERAAGTGYATPEGPRAFATRTETIAIRGAPSETMIVRETRHGPLLTDLDPTTRTDGLMVALAMANLAPDDTVAAGLHALNRGQTLADARAAAAQITSPPQNLMVATRGGDIAMYLTGRTPIRRSGDGTLPFEGWNPAQGWSGFVPFDAMPHLENPASGLLANANNRPAPRDHPVFLGASFPASWRFLRAMALLEERPRHSSADFAAMQVDTLSLFALAVRPALAAMPRPDGAAGAALDLMLAWDGHAGAALPQPLIFNAFVEQFGRAVMRAAGLPDNAHAPGQDFLAAVLDGRLAHWCGGQGCGAIAATALVEAVRGIAAEQGPDPAAWRWGAAHVARFEHPLLRFIPALAALTRMEVPASGDGDTLLRAAFRGGDFAAIHGAGLRAVFDLSDPDGTLAVTATGQSGHPMSRHWRNLLPAWRDGLVLRLDGRGTDGGSVGLHP
ncbi:MAG: penicillin acylase family protein [Pseudomonadota bacterium]